MKKTLVGVPLRSVGISIYMKQTSALVPWLALSASLVLNLRTACFFETWLGHVNFLISVLNLQRYQVKRAGD